MVGTADSSSPSSSSGARTTTRIMLAAPRAEPAVKIDESIFQAGLIFLPRDPVHSRCGFPLQRVKAFPEQIGTTDPDSTYTTKGGPARLGYYDNYVVDNASCIIVGVQATPARLSQESVAARDMIERYRERYGDLPQTLAADTTYGNGELLQWLDERGIAAYIRVKENPNGPTDLYGIDQFTYIPEENCYICPEGKILKILPSVTLAATTH